MCLLLWTLPQNDHPRIQFAFASNRDECLDRPTAKANFWDVPTTNTSNNNTENEHVVSTHHTGIICGVDCKPPKANLRNDQKLPGTWVGITTEGDLVALTDYLESSSYYSQRTPSPPKPSRGQLCGDFLVTMAQSGPHKKAGEAERWIRQYAEAWDTTLEGLNLLVVQNSGEQQCVGTNREGSQLLVLHDEVQCPRESSFSTPQPSRWSKSYYPTPATSPGLSEANNNNLQIASGSIAGLSNSVFSRPWKRVEIGMEALESTLNKSLDLFGCGQHSSLEQQQSVPTSYDDSIEFVWLVVEILHLLKTHTKPYKEHVHTFDMFNKGVQDRVFVPRTNLEHLSLPHLRGEYGTRSSTVVLFGRDGRAVFVEKNWYAPRCPVSGDRRQFEANSPEGVTWWQGRIGRPREEWYQVQGENLAELFKNARNITVSREALSRNKR